MGIMTDLTDGIGKSVSEAEGWIADIKGKLPQLAARAAKLDQSPVMQALESLVLPPGVETIIARLITDAAAELSSLSVHTPEPPPAVTGDTTSFSPAGLGVTSHA